MKEKDRSKKYFFIVLDGLLRNYIFLRKRRLIIMKSSKKLLKKTHLSKARGAKSWAYGKGSKIAGMYYRIKTPSLAKRPKSFY